MVRQEGQVRFVEVAFLGTGSMTEGDDPVTRGELRTTPDRPDTAGVPVRPRLLPCLAGGGSISRALSWPWWDFHPPLGGTIPASTSSFRESGRSG